MTRPLFKYEFSLGNMIQIAVIIASLALGWQAMDSRTSANREYIERHEELFMKQGARLRDLEGNSVRQDERYTSIFSLLARIDARLERIEGSRQ